MWRGVPTIALMTAASLAAAGPDDGLAETNARLRQRVETLERENARLRAMVPRSEVDDAATVALTERPDGSTSARATMPLTVTGGSRAAHELRLEYAGDAPPEAIIATTFSGGIYRHVDALELDVDDTTHVLPVADYDVTRVTTGSPQRRRRLDHERVTVTLSPAVLAAITDATSVGGRLGRVRFLVEARDQPTLAAFARAVTGALAASTPP